MTLTPIVIISSFVAYQNNQANKQFELEMRIAEQERIVKEQRIQEIKKELAISMRTWIRPNNN